MTGDLRAAASVRAGERCEYCRLHQALQGATFHLEHVVPRSRGGPTELDNLALACPSCNLHKADRLLVQSASATEFVPLFNPRQHHWRDHFEWQGYQITGTTEIGRATIVALDLNHERRVQIRQSEHRLGLFPPDP